MSSGNGHGLIFLSSEQRKALSAHMQRIPKSLAFGAAPPDLDLKIWKDVHHGQASVLTSDELRMVADAAPGTLFALGLTSDRYT